jgi:hypothetical protein
MSTLLDGLKLSTAKKPAHIPQIVFRRNKLSSKLWEQIQLAKSHIDGTPFVVKKYRSFTDKESGLRKQIEVPKRIREWWFKNEAGKVCLAVKYGTKVIELAKGKHSVEVSNAEELVKALSTIKQAVEAGELDSQIELASGALKAGFRK